MDATHKGQVTRSAADVYEEFFVPALFGQWAPRVSQAAALSPGQHVLDVACGTGVLAREAERLVHPDGAVTGLDRNDGMLGVAGRLADRIEWRQGQAESLPFPDRHFDAVVSQFGLMFFEDRVVALKEMWRVLRPGGRLAVAVWDGLDHAPGYAAMASLLQQLFGEAVADSIRVPYCLGDRDAVLALFAEAEIGDAQIDTCDGDARFPSIAAWVHTDVRGWTLADVLDDAQYHRLLNAAELELQAFVQGDGSVRFRHPAHIITATRG